MPRRIVRQSGGVGTPFLRGDATGFIDDQAGCLIGEYDNAGVNLKAHVWLNDLPVAATPRPRTVSPATIITGKSAILTFTVTTPDCARRPVESGRRHPGAGHVWRSTRAHLRQTVASHGCCSRGNPGGRK